MAILKKSHAEPGCRCLRLIRGCCQISKDRLFCYHGPEGDVRGIDADEVNAYLAEISGLPFTAKDFRTWKATALAGGLLYARRGEPSKRRRRQAALEALDAAAALLGNTRSVCRKHYVHPGLVEHFLSGRFPELCAALPAGRSRWLESHERITLKLLERLAPPRA